MQKTYAEIQRDEAPLTYEQARLSVDFATGLRVALEERGWSVRELARLVGESDSDLSSQLEDASSLTLADLAALSFCLGKRVEIKLTDIT